jgi:hypothetical protein
MERVHSERMEEERHESNAKKEALGDVEEHVCLTKWISKHQRIHQRTWFKRAT